MTSIASTKTRRRGIRLAELPRPLTALVFAALIGGVTAPILIFNMPMMADYPNHLARVYAIAALGHDPLLARFYEIDWRIVPDLAVDAILPPLASAIGVFAAGKLFLASTIALLATGPVALYHALHRRIELWPCAAFLFVYNTDLSFGLLNYLFATALALWATASWIWLRDRKPLPRALASFAFILTLFFCHFLALGIYGMAITCHELWRWRKMRSARSALLREAAVLLVPFLLVLPLTLASPTVGFAPETLWSWPEKGLGIYYVFKSYSRPFAVSFALVAGAALLWGLTSKRLRLHPAGILFAALAALVYLAMPYELMGATMVDVRLPPTFALFLIGMSRWEQRSAVEARGFATALLVLGALPLIEVADFWARYQPDVAQIERSFAHIARGSRVLAAVRYPAADATAAQVLMHLPALVLIERSAFYSHLFSHPGKQPLRVKAPFRASAPLDGMPLPVEALAAADGQVVAVPPPGASDHDRQRHYWASWRRDYDYLYVLFGGGARPVLGGLELIDRGPDFALYRIVRSSAFQD